MFFAINKLPVGHTKAKIELFDAKRHILSIRSASPYLSIDGETTPSCQRNVIYSCQSTEIYGISKA